MRTLRLNLIRHGLTQGNLDGLYVGHTDMPLCKEGIEQLRQLKNDYTYPESQYVISSPLSRCIQTAEILFPDVKPIVIDSLIEYNFGEFDSRSAEDLHLRQPLFDRWLAGEEDVSPPFGESNREFAERVCGGFVKIVEGLLRTGTDNATVITHGGVIMTLLSNFGIPEAKPTDWLTPSGCGFSLRITPSLWMAGQKLEVTDELPLSEAEKANNYYDGWDYYPNDDDFDVSEYI